MSRRNKINQLSILNQAIKEKYDMNAKELYGLASILHKQGIKVHIVSSTKNLLEYHKETGYRLQIDQDITKHLKRVNPCYNVSGGVSSLLKAIALHS